MPNINGNQKLIVALNQCDFAMKGKYWDHQTNSPKQKLINYLQEKTFSISKITKESTNVDTTPIYYSALYQYNISKLFFYLLDSTPDEKRLIYIPNMSQDVQVWSNNDFQENYNEKIHKTFETSSNSFIKNFFDGFFESINILYKITHDILKQFIKFKF